MRCAAGPWRTVGANGSTRPAAGRTADRRGRRFERPARTDRRTAQMVHAPVLSSVLGARTAPAGSGGKRLWVYLSSKSLDNCRDELSIFLTEMSMRRTRTPNTLSPDRTRRGRIPSHSENRLTAIVDSLAPCTSLVEPLKRSPDATERSRVTPFPAAIIL